MATSGSFDFSLTAGEIIQAAYEDLGVVSPGVAASAADITMARSRLNMLVKQFQGNSDLAPGMKIHTRQRVTLFLQKGQQTYLVGPASSDARAATIYGRTTISADEASSQTTLSITSNTDTTTFPGSTVTMTDGDFIGIELNDGTIHWSTIDGTPGATVVIDDALASAASAGKYVWWFTSRAQRFPLIESAALRSENLNDMALTVFTDAREYDQGVPDKYADGSPTSILVEPLRLTTRITLDSQPTYVTETVVMTVLYPAEDYDSTSDDIAFPQEWFAALSWELAFRLSASVGRWTQEMQLNRQHALALARSVNPENSVLYFQTGGH